jgi:hypothetical protein
MCGRYARKSAQELLAEWFDLDLNLMPWFTASYNATPQSFQPVVWLDPESSQRRISLMRWGLDRDWKKDFLPCKKGDGSAAPDRVSPQRFQYPGRIDHGEACYLFRLSVSPESSQCPLHSTPICSILPMLGASGRLRSTSRSGRSLRSIGVDLG